MTTSRISSIVPLLLITLVCVGVVEGGYLLFEHFIFDAPPRVEVGEADGTAEQAEATGADVKKIDYRAILQRNLFGPPPDSGKSAIPPVRDNTEALAATSLDIVLMGTITGSEGTERAIILDKKTQRQELYEKGDAVQGALVSEIRRGKVILSQEGREEVLDISEAVKVRPPVYAAQVAPGQSSIPPGVVPRPSPRIAPSAPASKAQPVNVDRTRVRLSRENYLNRRNLSRNKNLTTTPGIQGE